MPAEATPEAWSVTATTIVLPLARSSTAVGAVPSMLMVR
jgi:hypothetical protein